MVESKAGDYRKRFQTTQWSIVVAAGNAHGDESRDALEQLCEKYWYPLYAFVRHRVGDVHAAQDLLLSFFSYLFEKHTLAAADRNRGTFRAFLLTSIKHFLSNERDKEQAAKRGGSLVKLSLDFDAGESRYNIEPFHRLTPDKIFERSWIHALLDKVLERLRDELAAAGKAREFELLKNALTDEATADDYERASAALGISPAAAKQAAYRMRKRYRSLFREEVAQTVADEAEIDEEIGRLLEILRN